MSDKKINFGLFIFFMMMGSFSAMICVIFGVVFESGFFAFAGLMQFLTGLLGASIVIHKATKHLSKEDWNDLMNRLP